MEGDNSENVDEENDHARNCNRARKIPHWVLGMSLIKTYLIFSPHLHLLNDEVEVVPPCVGEESGVEGQGDEGGVGHCVLPREVLRSAVSQLDKPGNNMVILKEFKGIRMYVRMLVVPCDADHDEGKQLGIGEVVLDLKQRVKCRQLSPMKILAMFICIAPTRVAHFTL